MILLCDQVIVNPHFSGDMPYNLQRAVKNSRLKSFVSFKTTMYDQKSDSIQNSIELRKKSY
jgi:hypothetical protein